ncbi:MAG: phosphatase PAP2 family protein [Candidatus Binataceae bacterium]
MALAVVLAPALAGAQGQSAPPTLSSDLTSDFKYLVNNTTRDAVDIVTSPLRIGQAGELLRSPRFYLVVAGSAAAMGGSFALDQTMRSHLNSMSSGDADLLENISYSSVSAGTGLLYAYGLYAHDSRAREYALTAGEGAGLASLFVLAIKAASGRLRPRQDHHDHDAFFHGGQSFVSGDVAPMFALAPALSEYFDNRWYVAAPIYSLALLDGFGRMGHDAHWFSDIVGAALVGAGTTELLIYLHRYHSEHPSRFQIFPAAAPAPSSRTSALPLGVTVAYSW